MAGTGGASASTIDPDRSTSCEPLDPERPGLGLRNVRSVIDPPLLLLCNPPRPTPPRVPLPMTLPPLLPAEDVDARRCIRFVCTLPTSSGLVVLDRRAAAAAAEESVAFDAGRARKAWPAAAVAAEEELRSTGGLAEEPRRREEEKREGIVVVVVEVRGDAPVALEGVQVDGM